ncbi:MAG: phosphatidylglycerol lysyltransferase domain-containing protein [Oscillospiraceae bacterium]|nr:phosphatidylglycerol lysyltransferase domain-containing protein [Oscillospiraceae bacterium]
MLKFEDIDIHHKPLFFSYKDFFREKTSEGSFAALYMWRDKFKVSLCDWGDMLYIRSAMGAHPSFLLPYGPGDLGASLLQLERYTEEQRYPLVLRGLTKATREKVEGVLPGRYAFTACPDIADYLYLASDLRTLPGKKYHAKRNFIARFESTYASRWSYEEISPDNIGDVWAFQAIWCRKNNYASNHSLQEESAAITLLLQNLESLGAYGGLLRVDGRVVAFTLGSPCGADTIDIHVEKADYDVVGAYQMINRAFLRHQGSWATYVNREEDLGLEGLRRAKLSYHPIELLMRYTAVRAAMHTDTDTDIDINMNSNG